MSAYRFHTVRELRVGPGASREAGEICSQLGIKRALIVTDPGLVSLGLVDPVHAALEKACETVRVFSAVTADPSESVVLDALKASEASQVDGVIGLGGGSSMDVAKAVAVLAAGKQELAELYGVDQVSGGRLPLILIPTTAGTGSEVTPVAVITTGKTTKAGISSAKLLPDAAVLDAELTVGLPAHVTAMTGIDAMVHAIEAYTSKVKKNPLSDMLARQSLSLLATHQRRVLTHPEDLVAREAMLLGATLAGQAFANAPVAAVHALAYPLGGHYHMPHGLTNALMLPAVLRFNASVSERDYLELARLLPQPRAEGFEGFVMWFEQLIADSGLPTSLADAKVPEDDLPMLAADAMNQQRLLVNNPVAVDEAAAFALYQRAWRGSS
ncbi:MAG: iron-containing alcohol dehydrogenase [Luminiphilus sp.]|jgi:alcohol dehydrogenase class IV|nr:iron-containing alcohol dehydrogenase [Luminiphilus sp.]